METIYCLFCGHGNSLSSMLCNSCGRPLPRVKEKDTEKKSYVIPIAPPLHASRQHHAGAERKAALSGRLSEKIAFDLKMAEILKKIIRTRLKRSFVSWSPSRMNISPF